MYTDYILLALGAVLLLAALVLAIGLLRSRRRGRDYRRLLQEETERLDVVSTLQSTASLAGAEKATVPLEADAPATVPLQDAKTILLQPEETERLAGGTPQVGAGLDLTPLEGKYILTKELHGGGMSRVFLARHAKLGNEWVVKYVDGAALANEAEVLKKLNHSSLPQIIDIFETSRGVFLVERYVEGFSLSQVLELGQSIRESQIADWGLQLAQVLHYLHNLDTPIIHCDLKPSNIMVTHDDRLVLIDFGISKRQGIDETALGITYDYAAPEQFTGRADDPAVTARRFGPLPASRQGWTIDQRTDIYSAGVILYELAMGRLPLAGTVEKIGESATPKFAAAIRKCLEIEPDRRFQSAKEMAAAFEAVKDQRLSMARSLVMRRVAAVCCVASLLAGTGATASGAYINQMENLAVVSMDPGRAVVTVQQSVEILIQKAAANGKVTFIEPAKVQWSYGADNIARLEGDTLTGVNVGETTLYGKYRNKVISLDITVTEPVEETTAVALGYLDGVWVSAYAGSGTRQATDGPLSSAAFVSPEGMDADGETLYVADSGVVRILEGGQVSTLALEPDFLTADLVRGWGGDLYICTGPWEDEEGSYYGFIRVSDAGAEFLYYTDAAWSTVTDFAFPSDGTLWFIQQNLGLGTTALHTLDVTTLESAWVMDLPESAWGMAFDGDDTLYISVPETGSILRVGQGESSWTYFAGVENERHLIDGAVSNFYRPTALAADGDALYVLDFDTVRRITVEGAGALYTETLAGVPTEETSPAVTLGAGGETVLPASELASLALDGEGRLLLSDPKNSVIYEIELPR